MAVSVPKVASTDELSRLVIRPIPPYSKSSAIRGLAKRLEERGFDSAGAITLARTVVDPTDARRRLEWPTPIRVPGAVLWTIEADVWAPAIVPYIGNYREAANRIFPTDGTSEQGVARAPIRRPKGDPDGRPILDLEVEDRGHLVQAIEGSVNYLVEHNDLSDSIAEKGVMFPITLAVSRAVLGSGEDPVLLPTTVDGSSRTAGALNVLGVPSEDLVDVYREDARAVAGFVGRIRSISKRAADDEVSSEELGMANALILPARIIIGFEPDAAGSDDFAKAVHNLVQLIHGDLPPTVWSDTAKVDSKADSVVSELERADIITQNRALYMEGMLTPSEADQLDLPETPDERGLFIVNILSDPRDAVHAAIRAGVVQPSEKKPLTKWVKAEIAAELALRGARGTLTPKKAAQARDVLSNVYSSTMIWEQDLEPSGKDPDELLEAALAERRSGDSGPASAELAALGSFWLVVQRILRDPRFFKEENFTDGRVPSTVVTAMVDSVWGLEVLAKALADGRNGENVRKVDASGTATTDESGTGDVADHAWLRGTVVPPPNKKLRPARRGEPVVPERILLNRRKDLERAVEGLEGAHHDLRQVMGGDGEPLVDKQGLPIALTEDLRERIDIVSRKLVVYGATWSVTADVDPDGKEAWDER